jgi:TetR/AcrR family transcriptional regulator
MVNKKHRDAEATKGALLASAQALFARRGYDAVPIDEIAARAKANKAMIRYYFGGKEGLYQAILESLLAPAVDEIGKLRAAGLSPPDRLRRFIGIFARMHVRHPTLSVLVLRQLLAGPNPLNRKIFPYIRAVFAVVRETIEEGIGDGSFRQVDPRLTHLSLVMSLVTFFATAEARKEFFPADPDRYVDHVAELFLRGLQPSPRKGRP